MTGWRIAAELLPRLATGGPHLLSAPDVEGLGSAPIPVLVLRGGVLEAPSRTGPVTPVPLPAAPGRVLACLATGVEEAQALAEAWGSLAGTLPPPALAVQGIDHALLDLAQLLGAEANAWSAGRARLEAALVALRREAEETRIALAVAQRALSARPPQPLRLALGTEPAAEGVCAREKVLSQPLGLAVEGIAGVEVFVSTPGDGLRARLRGAESGRILGAWEVPQAPKGWLALDLPEAVGPLREGALLEISGGPTLALEAGEVEPEGELAGRPGRALALRVWTAQPGGHFALPLHYDWEAAGLAPPAPGVRLPVAPAAWAAARADGGRVELVGAGTEAARVTVLLPGSSRTTIRLPPLATGAADLVRLEVARSLGDAGSVTFALWLQPDDAPELREGGAGCAFSGWRFLDAEGVGVVTLRLPPGARRMVVEFTAMAGNAVVEVVSLALMAGAAGEARRAPRMPPLPAAMVAPATPVRPAMAAAIPRWEPPTAGTTRVLLPELDAPAPAAAGASFDDLKVHQHLVNPEGTYRHLDVTLTGLVSAAGLWRELRMKLFDRRGTIGLEFRDMRGWPVVFEAWPGKATDNFGPFWRVETEGAAAVMAQLATPRDKAMVAALLEVLPSAMHRAARSVGLGTADAEAWTARAERLAVAARR